MTNALFYLWVPALCVSCIVGAFVYNETANGKMHYAWNALPSVIGIFVWLFISKHTKNALFDSQLYDVTLTLVFTGTLVWLTSTQLNAIHLLGMALSVAGIIIFKMG